MPDENLPTQPTPFPSRAEAELAILEERRAQLLLQIEAENEAKQLATAPIRKLAIRMHREMCVENHTYVSACGWFADINADNPEAADWTELSHQRWLLVAHAGVYCAQDEGWTVEPPVTPIE